MIASEMRSMREEVEQQFAGKLSTVYDEVRGGMFPPDLDVYGVLYFSARHISVVVARKLTTPPVQGRGHVIRSFPACRSCRRCPFHSSSSFVVGVDDRRGVGNAGGRGNHRITVVDFDVALSLVLMTLATMELVLLLAVLPLLLPLLLPVAGAVDVIVITGFHRSYHIAVTMAPSSCFDWNLLQVQRLSSQNYDPSALAGKGV